MAIYLCTQNMKKNHIKASSLIIPLVIRVDASLCFSFWVYIKDISSYTFHGPQINEQTIQHVSTFRAYLWHKNKRCIQELPSGELT